MEIQETASASYSKFLRYSTIVLSGMLGAMLAIVWAPAFGAAKGLGIIAAGAILGLLVGYRRRNSKFFFYLTLVFICVLASVISFSLA